MRDLFFKKFDPTCFRVVMQFGFLVVILLYLNCIHTMMSGDNPNYESCKKNMQTGLLLTIINFPLINSETGIVDPLNESIQLTVLFLNLECEKFK